MRCICKLRVDELRKALGVAQQTVLGIDLPNVSAIENLAEGVPPIAENLTVPPISENAAAVVEANLSESESATVAAAAQLSETANMQATLQAELGVDMTLSSAPKALGGIIQAAQVSGLISFLQAVANFQGLNPLGAIANLISSVYNEHGIDLLEGKLANQISDDFDRISEGAGKQANKFGNMSKNGADKAGDGLDKIPSPEELERKAPEDLPGMIGDSIRKLNDYVKENPNVSRVSLADSIIDSLGSSLLIGLDDLDLDDLIAKAIESVERDFAADLIEEDDSQEEEDGGEDASEDEDAGNDQSDDNVNDGSGTDDDGKDEDEKEASFPDLIETVKSMIQHDLRGRSSWDQEKAATEALEKLEELEKLREEKIKEYEEALEKEESGEQEENEDTDEKGEEPASNDETVQDKAQGADESKVAEDVPKTEEELIAKILRDSDKAAKSAVASSVLASNSAIGSTNEVAGLLQDALTNPAISPETTGHLKQLSDSSVKSTLEASEASANALKYAKQAMKYAEAGELEKAMEAKMLAEKYSAEAEEARLEARQAKIGIAQIKNAIKLAEKEADEASKSSETVDSPEERARIVSEAVNSATGASMKAFGGNILSPSGLSLTARSVAAININGPALAMVNASVSTDMLLKAMANLAIFLLLKDVFGDSLLGPTGGSSIATSIGMAASAAAGASAGAGASLGAGAGAGAGGGAGAGMGMGAGAGASAGASASASAAINCMSGLLANSPPSPLAILLLIAILHQLRALGHDVVAKTPCRLSLEAMAGNDPTGYYEEFLAALGDIPEFPEIDEPGLSRLDNQDEGSEDNDDDETDSDIDKDDYGLAAEANQESGESDDNTLSAAGGSLVNDLSQTGSWFQSARRTSLKSNLGSGLGGGSGSDSDSSDADLNLSSLTAPGSSDSGSPASNLLDSSDSDSNSGTGDGDTGSDVTKEGSADNSVDQSASGAGDLTDNDAGNAAGTSGDGSSDDSDKLSGSPGDSNKSSLGKKVAAGAVGAVGIGAVAAMAMRGGGRGAGTGNSGSDDGGDSGSGDHADSNTGGDGIGGGAHDAKGQNSDGDATGSGAGLGMGAANMIDGAGSKGDGDDGPWHQRARRGNPTKDVSENTYAVGDPAVNAKQEDKEEEPKTDDPDFEEPEGSKGWHQHAKHDKTTEFRPEKADSSDLDDIEIPSDLDDSNDS